MGLSLATKIILEHLTDGKMITVQEIGMKIDQTLGHDATGTMAFLQFEAMDNPSPAFKYSRHGGACL